MKCIKIEQLFTETLQKRIEHISKICDSNVDPEIMKDYFTKRLSRIIVDYLLREGYFETAQQFVEETALEVRNKQID